MSEQPTDTGERSSPTGPGWGFRANPVVFGVSAFVIIAFVIFGVTLTETANEALGAVQDFAVEYGGWWLTLSTTLFVIFVLFLAISRYGRIRLGADDDRPEFSNWAWFAMLFSAGMGIGLVFWAVSEPIFHLLDPPRAQEGTVAAADDAMTYTFFHWGVHPWAVYIVMGMSLAYMSFRKGKPLTVRWALWPLLGDRVKGRIGDLIDIIAVFGTMFGIATSLGLGVSQVNAGLARLGVMEVGTTQAVVLIAIITAIATLSVVSGLDKGIKNLSMANIGFAGALMVIVLIAGPTLVILNGFVENIGNYVGQIIPISFETDAFGDGAWQAAWPTFYWAWWISWSPFVGMFIARISKGRTIREFVFGVMLVPTVVTMLWLTVFGQSGLHYERLGIGTIGEQAFEDEAFGTFALLETLPIPGALATVLVALTVLIVTLFFVTSSDSGSLVIDILTSDGDLDPPKGQRVFWAVSEGAVAGVLLWVGGEEALSALQTGAISTGLPFSIVLAAIAVSLYLAVRRDPAAGPTRRAGRAGAAAAAAPAAAEVVDPRTGSFEESEPIDDGNGTS